MTLWASRLREFHQSLGLTLLQWEEHSGIDATTLSRYLKGQRLPEIGFLAKLDVTVQARTGAGLKPEVKAAVRAEYLAACLVHEPQRHEVYVLRDELADAHTRLTAAEQTVEELGDQITAERHRRQALEAGLRQLETAAAEALHGLEELRRERDRALADRERLDELVREHLVDLELARRDLALSTHLHQEVTRALAAAEETLDDTLLRTAEATPDPPAPAPEQPGPPRSRWWNRTATDLARLREATTQAARVQLPDLVERLSGPGPWDVDVDLGSVGSYNNADVSRLASAIDALIREATRLAAEQALLRGNLNAVFTSLSRRSQGLIRRQLSLIVEMEQKESDGERLTDLFRLDHLATRMRRNSENLLVLAGEEPERRWSGPVPLVDVLRGAVAEVEEYHRVRLAAVPPCAISGGAATDLVHLLAELVENATVFSPPHTAVDVTGHALPDGRVLLQIDDAGLGIPADQLADINERLARPPVVNLTASLRLGLFVVASLGRRHDIRTQLRPSDTGGATAVVLLPTTVVEPVHRT
ncbi:ATP-binding protein [Streptomyces sp. NPDC089919]|uniref:ATP-binding protein n=1 Tax=Streptomyces sp. NPDC089919 TaxID=3155188 RepID=UPI00343AF0CD